MLELLTDPHAWVALLTLAALEIIGYDAASQMYVVANGGVDRQGRVAEIVAAAQLRQVRPVHRPQPAASEHLVELGQVQVQLEHPVAESVLHRRVPAVPDPAFIDGGVQSHLTPSARATSTPLRRPSSWKPKPQ